MRKKFLALLLALLPAAMFAQDLIVLKSGNIIEVKVMEISPTEIRYKRFDHLDGPVIVIPVVDVLSIRYENGRVDIISQVTTDRQGSVQPGGGDSPGKYQPGPVSPLQSILNLMPAVRVAGNNLKLPILVNSAQWFL